MRSCESSTQNSIHVEHGVPEMDRLDHTPILGAACSQRYLTPTAARSSPNEKVMIRTIYHRAVRRVHNNRATTDAAWSLIGTIQLPCTRAGHAWRGKVRNNTSLFERLEERPQMLVPASDARICTCLT